MSIDVAWYAKIAAISHGMYRFNLWEKSPMADDPWFCRRCGKGLDEHDHSTWIEPHFFCRGTSLTQAFVTGDHDPLDDEIWYDPQRNPYQKHAGKSGREA